MQLKLKNKYEVVNFQNVLKNYQNKKQLTKSIYPIHNHSLNYKGQKHQKQTINQIKTISQDKSQIFSSQKYFGKLPEAFKTMESDCCKNIQRVSQNILKRKVLIKNIKNMNLRSLKPYKINRRKLKDMTESTNTDSVFQQKNNKTLQFLLKQKAINYQSYEGRKFFNIISERKIKSQNDFVESHDRIKTQNNEELTIKINTQKYEQLNLRNLIYDDKQLTMSQKKRLKSISKLNTQTSANQLKKFYKNTEKYANQNFFRFKTYKQKDRKVKNQKQHEQKVNSQIQQTVKQGWIINESNASVF